MAEAINGSTILTILTKAKRITSKDFRLCHGNREIYPNQQLWKFNSGDVLQLKLRLLGGARTDEHTDTYWIRMNEY